MYLSQAAVHDKASEENQFDGSQLVLQYHWYFLGGMVCCTSIHVNSEDVPACKEKFGNGHSPKRMRSEIYIHVLSLFFGGYLFW